MVAREVRGGMGSFPVLTMKDNCSGEKQGDPVLQPVACVERQRFPFWREGERNGERNGKGANLACKV